MRAQTAKIQELLGAEESPLRDELLRLGFDALAGIPLAQLTGSEPIAELVARALTRENVARISERHVLPGIARVREALQQRDQKLRDVLSPEAERIVQALATTRSHPSLSWLRGALDSEDLRQLLAPVVQQVLVQFTTKLPLFGAVPGSSAGLGGLMGMLGKQVQKGAGQLADVGRSVMSGLGGEFERRMQAVARDFSQTATAEFRSALVERLRSEEGKRILVRMRGRVVAHTLEASLGGVAVDLLELPLHDIARLSAEVLEKLAREAWFRALLAQAVGGVLTELGQRSLKDVLDEAGLLEPARAQISAAVLPGLRALVVSQPFGAWLERLLAESRTP